MMRICRFVLVVALIAAPMPVIAVDSSMSVSQEDGSDDGGLEPASTDPAGTSSAGSAGQSEVVTVFETRYITEVVTVEQIVPVTETVLITEIVTVEQIVPVTETVLITEVVTVEQIVPVTETVLITEVVTVEQNVPVTETVLITEIVTVEQNVPVTETVLITEVVTVEQIVPVTETVVITEIVPVTVIVTETVVVTETVAVAEKIESSEAPPAPPTALEGESIEFPPDAPQPEATVTPAATTTSQTGPSQASSTALRLTHWTQLKPPYSEPTPLPVSGLAMYYAPNVMDNVAVYRERVNRIEDCEECVGQVALLRAGDIGRYVWIQVGEGAVEGPFQVLDVAGRHHIPDLLRRNWVVDVDYETAMRWGMRGPIEVTVFAEPQETIAMAPRHAR